MSFKVGDRVVFISGVDNYKIDRYGEAGTVWSIIHESVIGIQLRVDYDNPTIGRVYGIEESYYIPEEVYNSTLYKAMRETDNE